MESLKDCMYTNQISALERGLLFLEAEYNELLTHEVRIDEDSENQLNAILNDAQARIDAARQRLSAAGKITDPAERKATVSRAMSELNRTRGLLDKVVNTFFPEKVDGGFAAPRSNDEFVSPQQAAETLGISTSQLQSLVMANKLRMHNHNGKWALKGSDVQALADNPEAPKQKRNFGDALRNTSFGQRLSSMMR